MSFAIMCRNKDALREMFSRMPSMVNLIRGDIDAQQLLAEDQRNMNTIMTHWLSYVLWQVEHHVPFILPDAYEIALESTAEVDVLQIVAGVRSPSNIVLKRALKNEVYDEVRDFEDSVIAQAGEIHA